MLTDERITALVMVRPDMAQAVYHDLVPIEAFVELARAVLAAAPQQPAVSAEPAAFFVVAPIGAEGGGPLYIQAARRFWNDGDTVPLYHGTQPKACPIPCGWKKLASLWIEDGAYLARSLQEGEPITENQRATVMRMIGTGRDVLLAMAKHSAAPQDAHGCTRSHPHENMDACCQRKTEEARANNEAANAAYQDAAQDVAPIIPDGWVLERKDGAIVVRKQKVGGYVARPNEDNIASEILYLLAEDMLSAAMKKGGAE